MIRKVVIAAAAVAAVALLAQSAEAGGRRKVDPRLVVTDAAVGAGATAAYFALNDWHWKWDSARHGITSVGAYGLTTLGCAALSPIVGTAVVQRPLTYREAHIMVADCVLPIIGGWLVNEAYNEHILWAPDEVPPPAKKHHRHHVAAK